MSRATRVVVTVLLLALVLAGTGASMAATADGGTPASPRTAAGSLLLGAHVDLGSSTSSAAAIATYESTIGRKLDVLRWFERWDDAVPDQYAVAAAGRGRVLMLSVLPERRDGTYVSWSSIAAGDVDGDIRTQAASVKAFGSTVYLTFHHEANLPTGAAWGTPAQFIAAWRHYVAVFRAAGVSNVLWTWIATPGAFDAQAASPTGADFYPGDDVVDRLGVDAYNRFGCSPGSATDWRSMATILAGFRQFADLHAKAVVLPEWGSVEDPAQPGRKAAWIHEAFAYLRGWPALEAALYFDDTGTCAWRTSTSTSSAAAYRQEVAAGTTHGRSSAWLVPSITAGPAPLTVSFAAGGSAGAGSATGSGVITWQIDYGDGTTARGTGQPGTLSHTFAKGTYAVRLMVCGAQGSSNTDTTSIAAVPAPVVTGQVERPTTSSGSTLTTWVDTGGLAGTLTTSWSTAAGVPVGQTTSTLTATKGVQSVAVPVTGLAVHTAYTWTVTAKSVAGSTTPVVRTFWTTRS